LSDHLPLPAPCLRTQESIKLVESETRYWLERAVIGLNLCPFAKGVLVKNQVHFTVSHAVNVETLLADLERELVQLADMSAELRDTTLLMAPSCLQGFLDFNDFLVLAERLLSSLRLDGELQIASFHPDFQFAGTAQDDVTNCTNRAPYPTLHLLRESSIDRAVQAFPQAEMIFEENMNTLVALGFQGWHALGMARGKIGP
jgi:uncharacterized protein